MNWKCKIQIRKRACVGFFICLSLLGTSLSKVSAQESIEQSRLTAENSRWYNQTMGTLRDKMLEAEILKRQIDQQFKQEVIDSNAESKVDAETAADQVVQESVVELEQLEREIAIKINQVAEFLWRINYVDLDEGDYIKARRAVQTAPAQDKEAAKAVRDDLKVVAQNRNRQVNMLLNEAIQEIQAQVRSELSKEN